MTSEIKTSVPEFILGQIDEIVNNDKKIESLVATLKNENIRNIVDCQQLLTDKLR